jgi:hypothetical protein
MNGREKGCYIHIYNSPNHYFESIEISKNINKDDLVIQNKSFYIDTNTYQSLYNYIIFFEKSIYAEHISQISSCSSFFVFDSGSIVNCCA